MQDLMQELGRRCSGTNSPSRSLFLEAKPMSVSHLQQRGRAEVCPKARPHSRLYCKSVILNMLSWHLQLLKLEIICQIKHIVNGNHVSRNLLFPCMLLQNWLFLSLRLLNQKYTSFSLKQYKYIFHKLACYEFVAACLFLLTFLQDVLEIKVSLFVL